MDLVELFNLLIGAVIAVVSLLAFFAFLVVMWCICEIVIKVLAHKLKYPEKKTKFFTAVWCLCKVRIKELLPKTKEIQKNTELNQCNSNTEDYKTFRSKVYLCTVGWTNQKNYIYVSIHKETKELFQFEAKRTEDKKLLPDYDFVKRPQKITSYSQLLRCLAPTSKSYYSDLSEENWKEYFHFMFLPPSHSGETLRKQLLSQDDRIVRDALSTVVSNVLETPSERKAFLSDAHHNISLIKENIKNLDALKGMLFVRPPYIDRAIQMIEESDTDKCNCHLLIGEFGSMEGLLRTGFLLVRRNQVNNSSGHGDMCIRDSGIIECPICHKKYDITVFVGWHLDVIQFSEVLDTEKHNSNEEPYSSNTENNSTPKTETSKK